MKITEIETLRFLLANERLDRAREHLALAQADLAEKGAAFNAQVAALNAAYGGGTHIVTSVGPDGSATLEPKPPEKDPAT